MTKEQLDLIRRQATVGIDPQLSGGEIIEILDEVEKAKRTQLRLWWLLTSIRDQIKFEANSESGIVKRIDNELEWEG